jgi:hypothetical protein
VHIYRTLEGWDSLPLFNFIFVFPREEVSEEHIFSFQLNEGRRVVTSVDRLISCLSSMKKIKFWNSVVLCLFFVLKLDLSSLGFWCSYHF